MTVEILNRVCGNKTIEKKIEINELELMISRDTSIMAGALVDLFVKSNNNNQVKYEWSPNVNINCLTCPNPRVNPSRGTKYKVKVTDLTTGCSNTACVNIRVGCCK